MYPLRRRVLVTIGMDEKALNFLVADDFKNLFMFHYAPKRIESRDGKKLICCGDFHLGAHVTKMVRHRLTVLEPMDGSRPAEHRYATIFGSLDGGLGMMVPVDEKVFRRLFMLQQILVNALEHNAALNPKGFRYVLVCCFLLIFFEMCVASHSPAHTL